MKFEKIDGLIAAPYTPYLPNGEINTEIISDYAEKLKNEDPPFQDDSLPRLEETA